MLQPQNCLKRKIDKTSLVGGFNPSEKYQSNWIISPSRGENKEYLKPPVSIFYPSKKSRTSFFFHLCTCCFAKHRFPLPTPWKNTVKFPRVSSPRISFLFWDPSMVTGIGSPGSIVLCINTCELSQGNRHVWTSRGNEQSTNFIGIHETEYIPIYIWLMFIW